MEDIRSVLSQFQSKKNREKDVQKSGVGPSESASSSEIPDIFFDVILQKHKLSRIEVLVLMFLYRQVYCRANLFKAHGIGPLNGYAEMGTVLNLSPDEVTHAIRALENYGFLETIRSGQYFVRKYFTEEFDLKYGQDYDQFF